MTIADRPILDPEPPRPGIPLRKSTLAVFALLVLALGLVSSMVLSNDSKAMQPAPVAKDLAELKKTGSDQTLKDEEAEAAKLARFGAGGQRIPVASAERAPAAGLPPPLPPLPAGVRRDDNTGALFDSKGRAQGRAVPGAGSRAGAGAGAGAGTPAGTAGATRDADLELEAQTRMAKALVYDLEGPREQAVMAGLARGLGIMGDGGAQASAASEPPSAAVSGQIDALNRQLLAGAQPAAAKGKDDWLREYAKDAAGARPITGYQAGTRFVLRQGKVIPAVLGREINSDLPGRITAYVSSDVFDAAGALLIPKGAALVGRYDSGVQVGQSRLMFAFQRLILPNGYSFDLPAAQGTDQAGAAGMTGDVNNHFLKMFGTSLLIAVLADRSRQPANVTQLGASGPVTAAGQVLSDVSKAVLERNRVIAPTITVDQGTRINVEVVADMVFPEAYPSR